MIMKIAIAALLGGGLLPGASCCRRVAAFVAVALGPSSPPVLRSTQTRSLASVSSTVLHVSSSSVSSSASDPILPIVDPVPVVLLSGFLGTGKTSALQHLLHDPNHRWRLGVVVNDMAAVNVDAKVLNANNSPWPGLRSGGGGGGGGGSGGDESPTGAAPSVVQMQNGCACCSLADELYVSVQQLLLSSSESSSSEPGQEEAALDAIVVELSGVADPAAIRSNWAAMAPLEIRQRADLRTVVTLVDPTTFGSDYLSWEEVQDRATTTSTTTPSSSSWGAELEGADEASSRRKVSELLAEQVEAADLVLLNKADLATPEQLEVAKAVASALNSKAAVKTVQFGRIDPRVLLGLDRKREKEEEESHDAPSQSHGGEEGSACADPQCSDQSHSHSHEHRHPPHKDEHEHDSHQDHACSDPDCTDANHSHAHGHHEHGPAPTTPASNSRTSLDRLGIGSFVYRATKPFEGRRLMNLLGNWPVPVKTVLDKELLLRDTSHAERDDEEGYYELGDPTTSPFVGLLRSKGFCWLAPSRWNPRGGSSSSSSASDAWRHDTAMYWSHAGKHFSISAAGRWWGTLDKDQMRQYFACNLEEYEKIVREDFVTDEFGDRRQEIVFIGTNLDPDKITAALDACLLNEAQMNIYRQKLQNYQQQVLSYEPGSTSSSSSSSSGLFGVGSSNHLDVDP